jgi:hypothetical protein
MYKRLRTQGLPLQESRDIMKNANEKLSVVKMEAGESEIGRAHV